MKKRLEGNLALYIHRCCLLRYISYAGRRLKKARVFKLLPGAREIAQNFPSVSELQQQLQTHNKSLLRGERMRLDPKLKVQTLICPSLDVFVLQMHSRDVAKALNSLRMFGSRVVELIQQEPLASEWWLDRNLLVHQRDWKSLCVAVMRIIRLTGFGDSVSDPEGVIVTPTPAIDRWPDRDLLESAARSASSIFGPFETQLSDCPPDIAASASAVNFLSNPASYVSEYSLCM